MKLRALALLLAVSVLAAGCENIKQLAGMGARKPAPAAAHKAAGPKKSAEAKPPIPFPKEQADAILDKQEKISTETRDAFLAGQLSKSEEDDLYFEPPADEKWSKLTPERR